MPIRKFRKVGKKKGYRKAKPWYSRKYSAMDAGRYALSQIWRLKGLINSEMHKLDNVASAVSVVNTGVVDCMNKVATGDSISTRTGNSIYVRSLNIKGSYAIGTSETSNFIRLAVVLDTQQISDTSPSWTDIYETTSTLAHLNPATVGRFKVLKDMRIVMNSANKPNGQFELNIPMRHHVRFNGTADTDIQKGSIYVVYLGSYTTNAPLLNYRARLSFHDN